MDGHVDGHMDGWMGSDDRVSIVAVLVIVMEVMVVLLAESILFELT